MELQREKNSSANITLMHRNFEWEKENGTPGNKKSMSISMNHDQENQVTFGCWTLNYMIVFEAFVISGVISQVNHIQGRIIGEPSEFDQEEVEQLAKPCLSMLNRLTYEVTEIAWIYQVLIWEF